MTTSLSTANPLPTGAGLPATPPGGVPDPGSATPYANEFLVVVPGAGTVPGVPPGVSAIEVPGEEDLRKLPAALAGGSGQSPVTLAQTPTASDADAVFYFLKTTPTTSPGVLPFVRPDRPGVDPNLNSAAPAAISTANPRAPATRHSLPGSQQGSSPPHTPGIEVGSQPFAGAVPPASAFPEPSEDSLRAGPGVLSGAIGAGPAAALASAGQGEPLYFLGGALSSPRVPVDVNLPARGAEYEAVPDVGLPRSSSPNLNVPSGGLYFIDEVIRLGTQG